MTALTKLQDFFKYLCYTDDEPEPLLVSVVVFLNNVLTAWLHFK